jgi:hypothetical protein
MPNTPTVRPTAVQSPPPTPNPPPAAAAPPLEFISLQQFDGRAAAFTTDESGTLYLVTGEGDGIFLYISEDDGRNFSDPLRVNQNIPAFSANIERPSISVQPGGRIGVTWLQLISHNQSIVWYAFSDDDGRNFSPPMAITSPDSAHRMLPRMNPSLTETSLIAWLQGGQLVAAFSSDGGRSFQPDQVVEQEVCDCCQPNPLVSGDNVFLAYRNVEEDQQGRQFRNIYLLTSDDGGQNFAEPVSVSDANWYLDSCPTAGPALAYEDGRLFAAFTDGRNDDGSLSRTDIYLAVSEDGGRTFSKNIRVNPVEGGYNGLSTLAVGPDGTLHLVWAASENGRHMLYYTTSTDNGRSFSPPQIISDSQQDPGIGRPDHPILSLRPDGRLYLLWLDNLGIHLVGSRQ